MSSHFSIKSHARLFAHVAFTATFAVMLLSSPDSIAQTLPVAVTEADTIQNSVQTLINDHRKILSLQVYSSATTTTPQQHQQAVRVGEYLFVEDQHISAGIIARLLAHGAQAEIDDFLAALANPTLKDADLFTVRSIVTEVAKKAVLNPQQARQLRGVLKNLAAAHNKYGQELDSALSQKVIAQTKPERPAWAAYIAEVEQQYPAAQVLASLGSALPTVEQQATPSDKSAEIVAQTRATEMQGLQLEKGSVLLTFDDGPHPIYTREILAILARYKVKAIFFQLGENLGTVTDGHAELTRNEDIEKEILSAGHAIGNHSFSHPFLPKLDQEQVQQEIDKTQALLDLVITDDTHRTHMFRAPYGARNAMVFGEIGERGLHSVLWNIDSLDWSDPVPESIVHRILQELEHSGRGIILMHDIHPKTVIALPMLLDELIKRGYHFVQWDNGNLVATVRDTTETTPTATPVAPTAP